MLSVSWVILILAYIRDTLVIIRNGDYGSKKQLN